MSSRAVRKTAGHTVQDDLVQVLQKVGLDKNNNTNANDDNEHDSIIDTGHVQRRNAFEMLEDEGRLSVDSDNVSNERDDEHVSTVPSKTKRKRRVKKKGVQVAKTDEVGDGTAQSNVLTRTRSI
jgi:hypothetical protein